MIFRRRSFIGAWTTAAMLFCVAAARASSVTLQWDANPESDLAGYRLWWSTTSLLGDTTTQAIDDPLVNTLQMGTSEQISLSTEVMRSLAAGTTMFYRLTAFDTNYNESEFNVDDSSHPAEVAVFIKRGDTNGDGVVDEIDLSIFKSDWGTSRARSDFNDDGVVDEIDYSLLKANWGP